MGSLTRTTETVLGLASFGYLVDKKTKAPKSPKKNSPHMHPLTGRRGFSGLCSGMRFCLLFKKTKATCSAGHGVPSAIFSLLCLQTAKG